MKSLSNFCTLVLATIFTFSSCSNDDTTSPQTAKDIYACGIEFNGLLTLLKHGKTE